jgi:hypothetical protein
VNSQEFSQPLQFTFLSRYGKTMFLAVGVRDVNAPVGQRLTHAPQEMQLLSFNGKLKAVTGIVEKPLPKSPKFSV